MLFTSQGSISLRKYTCPITLAPRIKLLKCPQIQLPRPPMNPDLGLTYHQQSLTGDQPVEFLQIRFSEIDFVSPELCTTLFDVPWGDEARLHALSLDFDQQILLELLARLSPESQQTFLAEVNGQLPPFHVSLPEPVLIERLWCALGEEQQVEGESFIPFIIQSLE